MADINKYISCGSGFVVAIREDGSVVCWGNEQYDPPNKLTDVQSISCGSNFAVALKNDATIVYWGYDWHNQYDYQNGLIVSRFKELTNVQSISCGHEFFVALNKDSTIVCWGANTDGQCDVPEGLSEVGSYGLSEARSNESKGLSNVQISCGPNFVAALKEDRTVVCWGNNDYGQCNVPDGLINVQFISCGEFFVIALKEDGTVVCWVYEII